LISISDQKVFAVTSGQMEVLKIMAWDEDKKKIYFLATGIEKPGERHLYRKFLDANTLVDSYGKRRSSTMDDFECLTCSTELKLFNNQVDNMTIYHYYNTNNANNQNNNNNNDHRMYNSSINCLYNDITLSRKFSYYILECLGPHVPSIYLIDTETNEKISTIDDGILFHRRMVEYIKPEMEQFAVQTKNGFHTQVKVYLPPEMKKNLAATFPLILHV
jgi:inactive dipeptidyl peptidase 10